MIDLAWQQGAQHPAHLVSDGNGAIAARIELVYGEDAARRLLDAGSLAEGRERARRIMRATAGAARYWCEKALSKGLRHLATGPVAHRTSRDWSGTTVSCGGVSSWGAVWTEHNLLALLQKQGLLNQTT